MIDIRKDDEGLVTEIVAKNCRLYITPLDKSQWSIAVEDDDEPGMSLTFHASEFPVIWQDPHGPTLRGAASQALELLRAIKRHLGKDDVWPIKTILERIDAVLENA